MSTDEKIQKLLEEIQLTHDLRAAQKLVKLLELAGAEGLPEYVWYVHLSHRYGSGSEVFRTKEGAKNYLYNWAREWWDECFNEEDPIPNNREETIERYFEIQGDRGEEFYQMEEVQLGD